MTDDQIGAFFDFDETLLDTESSRLGFKYLWERRLVSRGFIAKVMIANFFYKRHWISDERIAAVMLKFYQGKRLEEFEESEGVTALIGVALLEQGVARGVEGRVAEAEEK